MSGSKSIYDGPELQDRIRKLKAQQTDLQKTKDSLQAELEAKTKKFSAMKQELVLLAPNEALRFQIGGPDIIEDDTLDNSRFLLMNEKLEMQILVAEIHAALPRLEQEAKSAEAAAKIQSKGMNSGANVTGSRPLLMARTEAELEAVIQQTVGELVHTRNEQELSLQNCKRGNKELSAKIAGARKELSRLLQDKMSMELAVLQGIQRPSLETERYKSMLKQQKELRNRIQDFHDGYGWQTEAFRQIAGKNGGTALVSKIAPVLADWLCVDSSDKNWQREDYLQGVLREIRTGIALPTPDVAAHVLTEDEEEDELLVMADTLITPSPSKQALQPVNEVDWATFCQLCDRLCILLEK